MLAAIDIHKAVFQAAVFDPADGAITEEQFKASRDRLAEWLAEWEGKLHAAALEATTGWRRVARELQSRGIEVRLTDAGQRARCKVTASGPRLTVLMRGGSRQSVCIPAPAPRSKRC